MKNCKGPCLPHCYQDKQLIFLVVGFILGILAYIVVERLLNNKKEEDKFNKTILAPESSI